MITPTLINEDEELYNKPHPSLRDTFPDWEGMLVGSP